MNVVAKLPLSPRIYRRVLKTRRRFDPYRESSVRFMGYANEVGEALEDYLPDWGVPTSYCVAAVYIMSDTLDKGQKAFDAAPRSERFEETVRVSSETLLWQLLASIFWPGGVIKLTISILDIVIPNDNEYLPTFIAITLIPFIVRPIDELVDRIMEESISKVMRGDVLSGLWATVGSPQLLYILAAVLKPK